MQARLESVKMSWIGAKKMKDRMGGTAEREECVEGGTDGGCRTAAQAYGWFLFMGSDSIEVGGYIVCLHIIFLFHGEEYH